MGRANESKGQKQRRLQRQSGHAKREAMKEEKKQEATKKQQSNDTIVNEESVHINDTTKNQELSYAEREIARFNQALLDNPV
jgi:hypothetical protein